MRQYLVSTCIALRSALNSALLFFGPSPSSETALSLLSLLVLLLGDCCCDFTGAAFFSGVGSSVLSVVDDRSGLLVALPDSLVFFCEPDSLVCESLDEPDLEDFAGDFSLLILSIVAEYHNHNLSVNT